MSRPVELTLGSYLKMFAAMSFGLGLCVGAFALFAVLTEGKVTFHIGSSFNYQGIEAALAWTLFAPLALVLVSPVAGILSYLPVRLILRVTGGLHARE